MLRAAIIRQRLHPRFRRFGKALQRQFRAGYQPRLNFGNAGYFGEPRQHGLRYALRLHPDFGKARLAVEGIAGIAQRQERRLCHHQHGDAGGYHQGNGKRLAAHPP